MSKDNVAIIVLIVLYLAQGIPLGLFTGALPFLFAAEFSYSDQAILSLAGYPYALKLLWAPIVDCVFSTKIGRRKSWVFPCQILMGAVMMYMSFNIDNWISDSQIYTLTFWIFIAVVFTATQDIAVDGWSLTMLSKENVSYQAPLQSLGMTLGYFIGFPLFLAFNSKEVCKNFFNSESELMTLANAFYIGGVTLIILALVITLFVREKAVSNRQEFKIVNGYTEIRELLKLPNLRKLAWILLTKDVTFSAFGALTGINMTKSGFPNEAWGIIVFILIPFGASSILFIRYLRNKHLLGDNYLTQWGYSYIFRIMFIFVAANTVYHFKMDPNENVSSRIYLKLISLAIMGDLCSTFQSQQMNSFFAAIADPVMGGTYLTLLNTFGNFGGVWPKYFVLKCADFFSKGDDDPNNNGYIVMVVFCAIYGLIWIKMMKPTLQELDNEPKDQSWSVSRHQYKKIDTSDIKF